MRVADRMMKANIDQTFHSMGSDVRLLIEPGLTARVEPPEVAAARERAYVLDYAWRLSRFEPDSELTALNRDPRREVPASPLLRAAVAAGVWAAQRSGGLIDPTLAGAMRSAGYFESMDGREPAGLREALAWAPRRGPAAPDPDSRWQEIEVDELAAVIVRPPGTEIDNGGTGKGLCADAVAHRLGGHARYLVDCGGDIAVGGVGAQLHPYEIEVQHPLSGDSVATISLGRGGVATSGLNVRIWRRADGGYAHHLLDPSTLEPAWTGLIAATAISPDGALEAETLSKMALLLGPSGAREVLAEHGGVIVHDDGEVELLGPLRSSEDGLASSTAGDPVVDGAIR